MFHFEVTDEPIPETPQTPRSSGGGTEATLAESYNIGDEIHDMDKYIGMVKYIGSVGKYAGDWLGIEWKDPCRGKHSGSVDDIEYFKCSVSNSGSFIRPHKARKIRHMKDALQLRYGHDDSLSTIKSIEDRLERKKISYSELRTINLSCKGVKDSPDDIQEIISLCPNVETLELTDNVVKSWSFIGCLCAGFSKLTRLDLSKNPLNAITEDELNEHKRAFEKVKHIIMGGVGYDWSAFLRLSILWPGITNLQVPFNQITLVTPPTVTLKDIVSLDLEGNTIACWKEVLKFTVLERLEYLNVCGNALKTVRFPTETDQVHTTHTSFFPNLIKLNLTENSIDDWISVSELNKLKSLSELRLDLNPVMNKDTRANNRQMVIARIGKLHKLEGVEINRQERRDAEIDYVKRLFSQWEVEKDSFRFTAENPRYSEMVEKWGQSEAGEVNTVIKTMKSSLININLVSQIQTHKACVKKVIPTMTVQKLKGLIQRVFREGGPPVKITAVSSRNPGISFTLEDDFTDLATYSIEEGDKLLIYW